MGGYVDRVAPSSMGLRGLLLLGFLIISFSYLLYSANLLVSGPKDCSPDHISLALANSTSIPKTVSSNTTLLRQVVGDDNKQEEDTNLSHIVFGIAASSDLWQNRKEYIKQWWRPGSTRGVVWIDKRVRTYRNESLPEIRVSGDTSKLPYSHTHGTRAALRLSRIVSETLRLKQKNVRWFVMGDDDTVFVVDNVVSLLQKFDHRQFYYIGSPSESHIQNLLFSYGMAYGGGGFAISYALAVELEKMQDQCISRYAHLYGSDDRIHACMTELGVPLTRHPGFHQVRY